MRALMLKRLAVSAILIGCLWPIASAVARHDAVGARVSAPLDRRFRQSAPNDPVVGILVPSGNVARLEEAIGLARRYPDARVYLIGEEPTFPADILMRELGDRLVVETSSTTTHENAARAARLIAPRADDLYLLVTDRMHMPRAVGSFRREGFRVHPWPIVSGPPAYRLSTRAAFYEWAGLVYYRSLGRTSELFPTSAP